MRRERDVAASRGSKEIRSIAWAMRSEWTVKSKCQRRAMTSLVSFGSRTHGHLVTVADVADRWWPPEAFWQATTGPPE